MTYRIMYFNRNYISEMYYFGGRPVTKTKLPRVKHAAIKRSLTIKINTIVIVIDDLSTSEIT